MFLQGLFAENLLKDELPIVRVREPAGLLDRLRRGHELLLLLIDIRMPQNKRRLVLEDIPQCLVAILWRVRFARAAGDQDTRILIQLQIRLSASWLNRVSKERGVERLQVQLLQSLLVLEYALQIIRTELLLHVGVKHRRIKVTEHALIRHIEVVLRAEAKRPEFVPHILYVVVELAQPILPVL